MLGKSMEKILVDRDYYYSLVRLLAEINAVGLNKNTYKDIQKSSGLSFDDVCEIFEANELEWERIKVEKVRA